jgi:molybdopterin molybdotransferase
LAEDVMSPVDLPGADYSAMDGYAVRADDFVGAGETSLSLIGQAQTGHPSAPLSAGGCVRIFTGAHIPAGADSVVMQENTTRTGDCITFLKAPRPGDNIRRRGEDVAQGARILSRGTRLSPHQLGLLASAERTEVVVSRRPRVAIVCTGDELRPFGTTFVGGQLAESNSVALSALCQDAGADVMLSPLIKDDLASISEALERAWAGADVVVTVGGVSVGDHDLVEPALVRMGGEVIFHKVAIKPGKPALFARRGAQLLLGLPGNPASAMVVFLLLGVPLLRGLAGDRSPAPRPRTACMTHDYSHKPGRRSFYRALVVGDEVTVLSNQASGATTSMAWANALLEMSETQLGCAAGERVPVWSFADL